jgi:gluconolactonase
MSDVTADPRLAELIDPGAELALLGEGYEFTEGPVWVPAEGCRYFSDIPGDARWRWTEERGMELVRRPTFKANGMCLDNDGHLLVCEQMTSCLVRFRGRGQDDASELIASHYEGGYLNSPNDVIVRGSDGSIYFSDPLGGRSRDWIGQQRNAVLDFKGVFRVPPGGGELELVVPRDEFEVPNGLCFSPDESILYINDSAARNVKAYDVAADGSLSNVRLIHEGIGTGVPGQGNVDGMECDELGNVWVTGLGGVWVLTPQGERLGIVPTPEVCGSLVWGGADMHTLFLTTSTTVHSVRTIVGPAPLPPFH